LLPSNETLLRKTHFIIVIVQESELQRLYELFNDIAGSEQGVDRSGFQEALGRLEVGKKSIQCCQNIVSRVFSYNLG
jgi:hypothetical protein